MKTLYIRMSGPMVRYDVSNETIYVDDLNPDQHMKWHMSRWEIWCLGANMLVAAISRKKK